MGTPCWSLCLWLWLMYAGVECLPNVRLRSRQEPEVQRPLKITIGFYIDGSVKETESNLITWMQNVKLLVQNDFIEYLGLPIELSEHVMNVSEEPGLVEELKRKNLDTYMQPDIAIPTLTDFFKSKQRPDIVCLVTTLDITNYNNVIKAYAYSSETTLCDSGVSMVLAYASYLTTHIAKQLYVEILKSIDPVKVPGVHHSPIDTKLDPLKKYLRGCGKEFPQPEPPPIPTPPSTTKEPETPEVPPGPPEEPETPETTTPETTTPETPTPAPPAPPAPPQPEPTPETTTPKPEEPEPEPQPPSPEEPTTTPKPPEVPPEEPEGTTTPAPTPDYC
uniref:Putative vegetative cell wall protein gp1 n=1 Tax=Ixodes ricinus TaxID=34613 RepID=A0A147BWX5_IXORI